MSEGSPQNNSSISLLDLLAVVIRHRWLIVLSTFASGVLIAAYSVYTINAAPDAPLNLLPNVYRPTVEVRLQETQGQTLSSFFPDSDLGFLANLAGGDVGGSSSSDLAHSLLVGNRILDELAVEFDLVNKLGIIRHPKSSTRAYLTKLFDSTFSSATGILTIGVEHTDRNFATEVLSSALEKLETRFKDLTASNVEIKKKILQQSIIDYAAELAVAQQTLIDFQTRNGIFSIELQTEYKLQSIAEVDSQILSKQSELRTLVGSRRADDPEVRRVGMELDTLIERRDILVRGGDASTATPGNIPQSQYPELSARFYNLTRDLQIIQTIYSGLRSQFESIKIEEKDTSSRFQIIEHAEVPELKSGPSRSLITIIVTITVFFLSIFLSFILEYFERVRRDPVESSKLLEIRRMLRRSR